VNAYLARLPPTAPIRSIQEMVAKAPDLVYPGTFESAKLEPLDRNAAFLAARAHQEMLREALIAVLDRFRLDALILPYRTIAAQTLEQVPSESGPLSSETRNALHAYTGLPTIIMPGGFFESDGMPFAVQFIGRPFSEPKLIALASGYEAATHHRRAPQSTPPLPGETIRYTDAAATLLTHR
jgi:Asp-tRNA(Asn)/Glu-tRNA(Gln) amidotransferase A subunit family amidase